ncbi:MAG: heparinase II/III family protein [Verrucomicrobia bacterium]|nr:heparinase II/III family protein [Verrucomicrobiota bacterium]
MSQTRRTFVRHAATLGAVLALSRGLTRPLLAAGAAPAKRGLLFDADDLPRIRATLQRPEFAAFWRWAREADLAADTRFITQELRPANLIVDAARVQDILHRCAFVHVVAPDPKQLALARLALNRLLAYPRWDWILEDGRLTVGVMRGAGFCNALALASEWLAADLTADEQAAISHRIAEEGGPACYRAVYGETHHESVKGWTMDPTSDGLNLADVSRWPVILDKTNLRVIATSGLVSAALHLHGRHPDADKWLDLARASLKRYAGFLPKDGSFEEGIGYWEFTFTYYIYSLEVMRRRLDIDDRHLVNFPAMANYAATMAMPTAENPTDSINIGDAGSAASAVPLAWIAREYHNPVAQYLVDQPGIVRSFWTSAWAAIWFDPSVPDTLPADLPLDRLVAPDVVISRSGWKVPDSVLAFRSGGPNNHEHADRNSVLLKAHGERLLNDPLHASYSPKAPKWLLRETVAHTAVLIAGRGHLYHHGEEGTNASTASATLQAHVTAPGSMYAISDATDAYRRAGLPVSLVQRTVIFLKPDVLILADRVALTEPQPVQARFQVFNEDNKGTATIDLHGAFTITRPLATLHTRTLGTGELRLATGQLDLPAAEGVYPFVELTSPAAREHTFITVCTTAPTVPALLPHGEIALARTGDKWTITGQHADQKIAVTLTYPANGLPVIKL